MALATVLVMAAMGPAAPAEAETASAPASVVETGPAAGIVLEKNTVRRPGYGLGVRDVSVDNGPEQYTLTAKSWGEIVRDDPDLSLLQRRGKMLGGGIAMTAIGGSWLAISGALALDGYYAHSAVGGLFQWVVPSVLLGSGAIMTMVALRSRRRLRKAQRRIFVAPYAANGQNGVTVAGRF